jgi:hypothetical protein
MMELYWIPSAKPQILQILLAIVLAVVEKALLRPLDQTIGNNQIPSDGFRTNSISRTPIGFCWINGLLYNPTQDPIDVIIPLHPVTRVECHNNHRECSEMDTRVFNYI